MMIQELADVVHKEACEVHRAAFRCGDLIIAFGNDGYRIDERSRNEVVFFREWLASQGFVETGFATSYDGYSWAMMARAPRRPWRAMQVQKALWYSWEKACGFDVEWEGCDTPKDEVLGGVQGSLSQRFTEMLESIMPPDCN
jgi:hypothetical protein